jgi:RNA polymerase sigma-70 factor (ECF subfamily)
VEEDGLDTVATAESEAALIERCRAGHKEAFEPIVREYAGMATGTAYLLLGNYDEALDASQEAFVRAWRHIRRFNPASPFYPWYRAILRNVCISRLRHRRRRKSVELGDGHADPREDHDPVLLAQRSERRDRLWRAIRRLPEPFREIIVMNHFEHLSYKEIAEALGIPIGTVMSRLHNARGALRERLASEAL